MSEGSPNPENSDTPQASLDIKKRRRELGRQLIGACETGNSALVDKLLGDPECDPNFKDSTTPLIVAVKRSYLQIVSILLGDIRVDVNKRDEIGQTPLIVASKLNAKEPLEKSTNLVVAKLLLDNPKTIIDAQDDAGTTALLYASFLGNFELTKALINAGADPNRWNNLENTPLHYAAMINDTEMTSFLLKNGAISDENADGKTPLDLATSHSVKELLRGKYTSDTHPLQVDFVNSSVCPVLGRAAVGMSMCPGRQNHKNWSRDIAKDMKVIMKHGTQVIITLMTIEELTRMGMKDLCATYEKHGIVSIQFGITDKWLPGSVDQFVQIVERTVQLIKQGKIIMIHCNGGKGRTGLLLVASLIKLGMPQSEATDAIRSVRPGMLYNPAQQAYLLALTAKLQNQSFGLLDKALEWWGGSKKNTQEPVSTNNTESNYSDTLPSSSQSNTISSTETNTNNNNNLINNINSNSVSPEEKRRPRRDAIEPRPKLTQTLTMSFSGNSPKQALKMSRSSESVEESVETSEKDKLNTYTITTTTTSTTTITTATSATTTTTTTTTTSTTTTTTTITTTTSQPTPTPTSPTKSNQTNKLEELPETRPKLLTVLSGKFPQLQPQNNTTTNDNDITYFVNRLN